MIGQMKHKPNKYTKVSNTPSKTDSQGNPKTVECTFSVNVDKKYGLITGILYNTFKVNKLVEVLIPAFDHSY